MVICPLLGAADEPPADPAEGLPVEQPASASTVAMPTAPMLTRVLVRISLTSLRLSCESDGYWEVRWGAVVVFRSPAASGGAVSPSVGAGLAYVKINS